MENKLLQSAYSPEYFRKRGHQLIDQLADHLDNTFNGKSDKVIRWNLPEDEYVFWKNYLVKGDNTQLFPEIVKHTTHVHNPKFIGHRSASIAAIQPVPAAVTAWR